MAAIPDLMERTGIVKKRLELEKQMELGKLGAGMPYKGRKQHGSAFDPNEGALPTAAAPTTPIVWQEGKRFPMGEPPAKVSAIPTYTNLSAGSPEGGIDAPTYKNGKLWEPAGGMVEGSAGTMFTSGKGPTPSDMAALRGQRTAMDATFPKIAPDIMAELNKLYKVSPARPQGMVAGNTRDLASEYDLYEKRVGKDNTIGFMPWVRDQAKNDPDAMGNAIAKGYIEKPGALPTSPAPGSTIGQAFASKMAGMRERTNRKQAMNIAESQARIAEGEARIAAGEAESKYKDILGRTALVGAGAKATKASTPDFKSVYEKEMAAAVETYNKGMGDMPFKDYNKRRKELGDWYTSVSGKEPPTETKASTAGVDEWGQSKK